MRPIRVLLALFAGLIWAASVAAQTPIQNPTAFSFDAPQFTQTYVDGTTGQTVPVIVSFAADYFLVGGTAPIQSTPFTKTAAVLVSGVNYKVLFAALPSYPVGANLQLKVRAIGGGGTGITGLSPQSFTQPAPVPAISNLSVQ